MSHDLPAPMKKILLRQIAVGTVVGCAFAAVYAYYGKFSLIWNFDLTS
jgi:hypothetical protein